MRAAPLVQNENSSVSQKPNIRTMKRMRIPHTYEKARIQDVECCRTCQLVETKSSVVFTAKGSIETSFLEHN